LSYVRVVAGRAGPIAAPAFGIGREQQERDQYRYYENHEDGYWRHVQNAYPIFTWYVRGGTKWVPLKVERKL
jgi:hypothetical protein